MVRLRDAVPIAFDSGHSRATRFPSDRLKNEAGFGVHVTHLIDDTGFACAGCGEWNETFVDPSAGKRQSYVEDCQVCCKPNVLQIAWDARREKFRIEAELEN